MSDYTRHFKVAKEILQSHLGAPILVAKAMVDACPEHVQMEDNYEDSMYFLFGSDQATMIDE